MIIRSITFALMSKQSTLTIRFWQELLFPKGGFFDVTAVNEDHTGVIEETGNERRVASSHIYLDEKDARKKSGDDKAINGFTESRQVNDFLSVITGSFFMSDVLDGLTAAGRNIILDRYSLLADNTSYSKVC